MMIDPSTLRNAPPVNTQPCMELVQWRVLQLADGVQVVAGMLPERPTLRITSPIATHHGAQIKTSSGRVYRLLGAPSSDREVLRSIAEHLSLTGHKGARDVTAQHLQLMQAALLVDTRDRQPASRGG